MCNKKNLLEDELDRMQTRSKRRKISKSEKTEQRGRPHARPKRKRKKSSFIILFLVLLLIIVGYAGRLWLRLPSEDDGYWTIAFFGVDSRDGNLGKSTLSDVEMICSINRETGEMRLVSVFRDSYLRVNRDGKYDKINQAYFLGGSQQAVEALETNLDLQIDDYAAFSWKAVANAINVLGGIDIEITEKEYAYINSFITETVNSTGIGSMHLEHSGMNHLDGVQAVSYARLRLMDTDFNRTERQRRVLGLAMEKAKQADFAQLKTLIGAVYSEISTSVGVDDLLRMAKDSQKYYIGQTSGFPFSHMEMKVNKKSCVIPTTLESNVIQLHTFLYDDSQYSPSGTVKQISQQIAEKTGLSDPGKDTESGKNIGVQGSTDNKQIGVKETVQANSEYSAESIVLESSEIASESHGESAEDSLIESPTIELNETIEIPPYGSENKPQVEYPENNSNHQAIIPEGSVSSGPGSTEGIPNQTNASLEGPGQGNHDHSDQFGPGV